MVKIMTSCIALVAASLIPLAACRDALADVTISVKGPVTIVVGRGERGGSYDDYIFRSPYEPAQRYRCGYADGYWGYYRHSPPAYERPSKFGLGYTPYPAAPYPPRAPIPVICPPSNYYMGG